MTESATPPTDVEAASRNSEENILAGLTPVRPSSASPAKEEAVDQNPARARRGAQRFAWAYLLAFLVGAIPVFASAEVFWPVPLIAMGLYLAIGTRLARESGVIFEFADSFYYLGFTLSVSSLLASLEPFNFVHRPDPEKVFHYFGLGMLTTLAGVVGRTMLQTYYRTPAETLETVNRQIADQAREYLENLAQLNTQVSSIVTKTATTYQEKVTPELDKIVAVLARTTVQIEAEASASATLTATSLAIARALSVLESRYTSAASAIGEHQTRLDASTVRFTEALERAAGVASQAGEQTGSGLGLVLMRAEACGTSLSNLAARVETLSLDTRPFNDAVAELGQTIGEAATRAQREFGGLRSAIDAYGDLASQLNASASDLQTRTMKETLSAFEIEISELVKVTRDQRQVTSEEIQTVREQLASLLEAAKSLSRVLDEIAEAAIRKLERIA